MVYFQTQTVPIAESQERMDPPYEKSRLYALRHSAAHLMAQSVLQLFPDAKLTIGPPIDNGFYYDIDFGDETFGDSELERVEEKMRENASRDLPVAREELTRNEAKERILTLRQDPYKLELLDDIPSEDEITFYTQGDFTDLCRGPHVDSTGEIQHFKLLSVAGAYWRGDEKNKMLTRLYGTAFETAEELEQHLINLKEAKKRDHRVLGRQLGLFTFSKSVGPGLPLWLPKGTIIRDVLCGFLKEEQVKRGYQPVVTPHIGKKELWEKSGHIETFKEGMFPFMERDESETFVLKPMNCPFHIEIYKSEMRSYRDLPIRYAEFGTVYRYEQSGELAGMLRVRGFTQDDAHLFVTPEQLPQEFKGVVELTVFVLEKLGLKDYWMRVGTRDAEADKFIGSDEVWRVAEEAIVKACDEMKLDYRVDVGHAAFYGPKLDLMIRDAIGRVWQMGTIQVDYNLPERFDMEYTGEDGKPHRPILIHRAPFGSLERMIALLTEQYAGAFPFWLAPVQVVILPIADRHVEYAQSVRCGLLEADQKLRIEIDDARDTLGKKIRKNEMQKIPYMLIVGDKDVANQTVSVRDRDDGDLGPKPLDEFVALIS
ncbi:MAG: threonine--tRNA ligase [Armatimonadetes bacterium]|nr:threonine--tRNA ligase [Armatimonadota bacterium]